MKQGSVKTEALRVVLYAGVSTVRQEEKDASGYGAFVSSTAFHRKAENISASGANFAPKIRTGIIIP